MTRSRDVTPVVQFAATTGRKKVLAFLEPPILTKYGLTLKRRLRHGARCLACEGHSLISRLANPMRA